MLRECLRVLKPGGRIRISTPNLANIASLMANPDAEDAAHYIKRVSAKYIPLNTRHLPGFVVNNFFWDFWHLFVYDPDTLRQALEEAGFTPSSSMPSGKSTAPDLCGLERHQAAVGADLDAFETMIFEGIKI
jgi:predicted SAM-dependent methyltransferase